LSVGIKRFVALRATSMELSGAMWGTHLHGTHAGSTHQWRPHHGPALLIQQLRRLQARENASLWSSMPEPSNARRGACPRPRLHTHTDHPPVPVVFAAR
jgi:hypothetical protein